MTRIARAVVPGLPHHVTQRGNRRERVFFEEGDYALYRDWLWITVTCPSLHFLCAMRYCPMIPVTAS
jgi:REP element-mobilizing transposase RayT